MYRLDVNWINTSLLDAMSLKGLVAVTAGVEQEVIKRGKLTLEGPS